jgi:oligogalacturonide transport system substrate-binding protein
MSITMASTTPAIVDGSPFQVGIFPLPTIENLKNPGYATTTSQVYPVTNYDAYKTEEAIKFVNWLVNNEEAYTVTGDTRGVPANAQAATKLASTGVIRKQMIDINLDCMDRIGIAADNGPSMTPEFQRLHIDYIQQVGYMYMTPKAAAEKFLAELEVLCAEKRR